MPRHRENPFPFNASIRRCYRVDSLESRLLLATVPPTFVDEAHGGVIDSGTALAFAPDGRLFSLSQAGVVNIIQTNGTTSAALSLNVNHFSERGLLGIAIDPAFTTNNFVYLYYTELPAGQDPLTYSGSTYNRVSRFTVTGNTINPASEQLVVRLDQLVAAGNHNAGAMNFGPDGKLYIAVGDSTDGRNSQSLSNRLGKILRLNSDGTIPADNPTTFAGISGTTSGVNRAIYAVGFRNPYSFTFAPNGDLYANEVGYNSFEEVNVIHAGANYGWPVTEGGFDPAVYPNFTNPLYYYGHGGGTQMGYAVTGGVYYSSNAPNSFGAEYQNKYFFCDYGGSWIDVIDPASPPATHSSASNFATGVLGIAGMTLGPDGAIYYMQREGEPGVRRIRRATSFAPVITRQPQDLTVAVGESATFSVEAIGSEPLAYQWERNGTDIPGATSSSYTFASATLGLNSSAIRVRITNAQGTTASRFALLSVNNNAAPVPVITTPADPTLFYSGQTISFSGGATDPEDGNLAASQLSWKVILHHDTHTHPFLGPLNGISSGSFVVPEVGEPSANIWYRVELTAVDSGGRSATTFRDIRPRTSTFTLNTSGVVPGATLTLDAIPIPAGTPTLGVIGFKRIIGAPDTVVLNGDTYQFASWSDGGAIVHEITTPSANAVFTANYQILTLGFNRAVGQVADTVGNAIPSARVYLDTNWNSQFDNGEPSTSTDSAGEYTLDFPGTGTMHVMLDDATAIPAIGYWYSVAVVGDQRTMNFTVAPTQNVNRASGTVLNTSGAGVANARVYLDSNWNSLFDAGEIAVFTDSGGAFSLVFPGTGTMHVLLDNLSATPADGYWYSIPAAGDVRTLEFTVASTPISNRVSGTVLFRSDAPVANARVYLDSNENSRFDAGEPSATTDSSGAYSLDFAGTGMTHLMLDRANVTPAIGYWYSITSTGDQRICDFVVSDSPLTNRAVGSVTSSAGVGVPNARVYLDTNWNSRFDPGEPSVLTNAAGKYVLEMFGSGRVHVMLDSLLANPAGGYWYSIVAAGDQRTLLFTLRNPAVYYARLWPAAIPSRRNRLELEI